MLRVFLSLSVVALVASGCAQSPDPSSNVVPGLHKAFQTTSSAPAVGRHSASFVVLHSFGGGKDGAAPGASLVVAGGALYGTTTGQSTAADVSTAFRLTTSGSESVLRRFAKNVQNNNAVPLAQLVVVSGVLYGTTSAGGANGLGNIFKMNEDGSGYAVLHQFRGKSSDDGDSPSGGLVVVGGVLYGTTKGGGNSGYGTVFKINPDGSAYTVLHDFGNPAYDSDGAWPEGNLIGVAGTLYGTTYAGGKGCPDPNIPGCGTIFAVSPSGSERVLYRFGSTGAKDGAYPTAGLVSVGGTLYGTTTANFDCGSCGGTVFSVSLSGTEHVVHRFVTPADGLQPFGNLTAYNGSLYGTTFGGGTGGNGTIFQMSTSGTETVLYAFSDSDGSQPLSGLVRINRTFFGTTQIGGGSPSCSNPNGCGTVFALTP